MKKFSKLNLLLFTSLMVMTGLSSCGKSSVIPDFEMPEGGFDTTKDVTITFYHTMNKTLSDVLDVFLNENTGLFTKAYPNIHVEHQQIGGYDDVKDQITTALSASGNDCDVAYCYPDHLAMYNKNKAIVSLDTLIYDQTTNEDGTLAYGMSAAEIADFIPSFWEEGKSFGDNTMYMLPWSKSSEVMYYNKTFFESHELSVPDHWFSTGSDDITSMEYVCAKIKEIDPNSTPLGYDSDSNWFITMCEQYNSGYTSYDENNHYIFDNATNREFVSKFKEWYGKGWVTTKSLNGQYTSSLFTAAPSETRRAYMSIGSSAGANNQVPEKVNGVSQFEVAITSIPQVDINNPKVISQGPSVCIFRNKDPQKVLASWLFVKFFTTNVLFQAQFSMASGYTPVINSVNDNATYQSFLNSSEVAAASTKQCLAQKDAYFISPAFAGSSDARVEVGNLLAAALSGSKSIDKAFADALSQLQYKG